MQESVLQVLFYSLHPAKADQRKFRHVADDAAGGPALAQLNGRGERRLKGHDRVSAVDKLGTRLEYDCRDKLSTGEVGVAYSARIGLTSLMAQGLSFSV